MGVGWGYVGFAGVLEHIQTVSETLPSVDEVEIPALQPLIKAELVKMPNKGNLLPMHVIPEGHCVEADLPLAWANEDSTLMTTHLEPLICICTCMRKHKHTPPSDLVEFP